tara:strand:- start:836 stop:1147 length:312 start_codon:yes stop_codon:yes gene_type:complete
MKKFYKINVLIISFVFLTGFVPFVALFGPASTIISTGNFAKAGVQFLVDQSIQKKTGKNSLTFVKEEIEKKNTNKKLNEQLRILVEQRIKIARQKIELQEINR